jgi:hypothetical protein
MVEAGENGLGDCSFFEIRKIPTRKPIKIFLDILGALPGAVSALRSCLSSEQKHSKTLLGPRRAGFGNLDCFEPAAGFKFAGLVTQKAAAETILFRPVTAL